MDEKKGPALMLPAIDRAINAISMIPEKDLADSESLRRLIIRSGYTDSAIADALVALWELAPELGRYKHVEQEYVNVLSDRETDHINYRRGIWLLIEACDGEIRIPPAAILDFDSRTMEFQEYLDPITGEYVYTVGHIPEGIKT